MLCLRLRSEAESEKVAIRLSRRKAFLQSLIHLAPILMTLTVLQFSFRTVYWSDFEESNSNQNAVLNTLQFVAKAHEICIVVSLSAIVLHRVQWDLTGTEGVPFGLVAAGYQVSSITYLWSMQFWAGIFESELLRGYLKRFRLFLLVIIAAFMVVLVGPSSAIAITPRLDWWPFSHPFLESTKTVIPIRHDEIWPLHLTDTHLDKQKCFSEQASRYHYCPSAGLATIEAWNLNFDWWNQGPNVTMPISDISTIRSLAASRSSLYKRGWTISSTTSDLITRTMSCLWSFGSHSVLGEERFQMNRPLLEASLPSIEVLLKLGVNVGCSLYSIPSKQRMRFPLRGVPIWIPDELWNSSTKISDPTKLTWFRLPRALSLSKSIGAVVVATVRGHPGSRRSYRMVAPCFVDARWIPVNMWLDPSRDNSIYDDQADIVNNPKSSLIRKTRGIHIEPSWAEALNVRLEGSNQSSLEKLITTYLSKTEYRPMRDDDLQTRGHPNTNLVDKQINSTQPQVIRPEYLEDWQIRSRDVIDGQWELHGSTSPNYPDIISYALSLSIADGLARHKSNEQIYSIPQRSSNPTLVSLLCSNIVFFQNNTQIEASMPNWTEIRFRTTRFGYGWGFSGTPVKFAAAVLLFNTLICLAHITNIIWGGWTSSVVGTIGELVALATNSLPSDKLKNTCAGIKKPKTWQKMVSIRETGTRHLEFVFEDGDDEETTGKVPIPDKTYGVISKSGQRAMIPRRRVCRK